MQSCVFGLFDVDGERHEACGGLHEPLTMSFVFLFPLWWVTRLPSHGGRHVGGYKCILPLFSVFCCFCLVSS